MRAALTEVYFDRSDILGNFFLSALCVLEIPACVNSAILCDAAECGSRLFGVLAGAVRKASDLLS